MSTKQSIHAKLNALLAANRLASRRVIVYKSGGYLVIEPVPGRQPARLTKRLKEARKRCREAVAHVKKMIRNKEEVEKSPSGLQPFPYFVGDYLRQAKEKEAAWKALTGKRKAC